MRRNGTEKKRAKSCPFIGKCDIKATMRATPFPTTAKRGIRKTARDKLCERKSILHFCAVCVSASFSLFIQTNKKYRVRAFPKTFTIGKRERERETEEKGEEETCESGTLRRKIHDDAAK